jgi:hypothetical protein
MSAQTAPADYNYEPFVAHLVALLSTYELGIEQLKSGKTPIPQYQHESTWQISLILRGISTLAKQRDDAKAKLAALTRSEDYDGPPPSDSDDSSGDDNDDDGPDAEPTPTATRQPLPPRTASQSPTPPKNKAGMTLPLDSIAPKLDPAKLFRNKVVPDANATVKSAPSRAIGDPFDCAPCPTCGTRVRL